MLAPLSNSNCVLPQKKSIESAPEAERLTPIPCAEKCTTDANAKAGKENKENPAAPPSQGVKQSRPSFAHVFVKPPTRDEMERPDRFCSEDRIGSESGSM